MNLLGGLYTLRNRTRDSWRYHFQVPAQSFMVSGGRLECDSSELGQFVWRRLCPIVGTRPFPPHELMLMCAAMLWLRPKMVIEWGTNIGVSARVFYEVNVRYKIGAEIHSIDLPDSVSHHEHPGHWCGVLVRGVPVFLHRGDGPTVAAALLRERACQAPLVFIDGDHEKESVLRDAYTILEVAPEAGLLFHDTFYQPTSSYNHGPYEAVQIILGHLGKSAQVIEAGLGCPGMTLILSSTSRHVNR